MPPAGGGGNTRAKQLKVKARKRPTPTGRPRGSTPPGHAGQSPKVKHTAPGPPTPGHGLPKLPRSKGQDLRSPDTREVGKLPMTAKVVYDKKGKPHRKIRFFKNTEYARAYADRLAQKKGLREIGTPEDDVLDLNKQQKREDDKELADVGYTSHGTTAEGLQAHEENVQRDSARKAQRKASAKRRKGSLIGNAWDELKDTVSSAPAIPGQLLDVGGEQAGKAAKLVESAVTMRPQAHAPTPKSDAVVEDFKESSPAYALAHGHPKEALGRAKERPLSAIGEAATGGAGVLKVTRGATALKEAGSLKGAEAVAKRRAAERVARPDLTSPNQPKAKARTRKAKVKLRAQRRDDAVAAQVRARETAAAQAKGAPIEHVADRPVPGSVRKKRRYSRNAAIRTVQKGRDKLTVAAGRNPHEAHGRRAARLRKRQGFDEPKRNIETGGIAREERSIEELQRSLAHAGVKKKGRSQKSGHLERAAVELLMTQRVRRGHEDADLAAVRKTIADDTESPHREANLSLLDELIDDAAGGAGHIRKAEVRQAARQVAEESRAGDEAQARTGYGDAEALNFVRLAQGPIARGEIRLRTRKRDAAGRPKRKSRPNAGGGDSSPLPRPAKRSIVDDQAPERAVVMGERGGGMNPGEQAPKVVPRRAESIEERKARVDRAAGADPADTPSVTSGRGSAQVRTSRVEPDQAAGAGRARAETKRRVEELSATLARQAEDARGKTVRGTEKGAEPQPTHLAQAVEVEEGMRHVSETLRKHPEGSRAHSIAMQQRLAFQAQYKQLAAASAVVRKRAGDLRALRQHREELASIPIRERSTPDKGTVAEEAFVPKVEDAQSTRLDQAINAAQADKKAARGSSSSPSKVAMDSDPEAAVSSGTTEDAPAPTGTEKSGTLRSRGATSGPTPDLSDGTTARYEDAITGAPIRDSGDLHRYHADPDEAAFLRATGRTPSADRTLGAPTAGHGYDPSDLLGPLGDKRVVDSALERERRTTLRQLYSLVVDKHALRAGEGGEVRRFGSEAEAKAAAPDGFKPLENRPERGASGGERQFVLVPDFIAKRVQRQIQPPGRGEALGRWSSRLAVRATLPFSVLWHAGNAVDLQLRLALSMTPEELASSGRVAEALRGQLDQLPEEIRAQVLAPLQGHFGSRETVRDPRFSDVIRGKRDRTRDDLRAAEISDAIGNFVKKGWPSRITDKAFDVSADLERGAIVGWGGKAGARMPAALGVAAQRYARELGHQIADFNEQMAALAKEISVDPDKLLELQRRVLEISGDYATRSPAERRIMAGVDVYWTWLRQSHRFVLKTLPERHPIKTAMLLMAANYTDQERLKAGVNYYWSDEELDKLRNEIQGVPERKEGYLAGAMDTADGVIPTVPFTSFGEVGGNLLEPGRLAGRLGSYVQRPLSAALGDYRTPLEVQERGLPDDSWISDLLGVDGEKADLEHHGDSAKRAANMVGESIVPGLHQARQFGEGPGFPDPDSTALHPKARAVGRKGGKPSTFDRVQRVANPFLAQTPPKDPGPKAPAPVPKGESYVITYHDPGTGQLVRRRVWRPK